MTTLENSYCVPKTEEEWSLMTELHGLQILSDVTFEQFKSYIVQNRYLGLAFISGKTDFFRGSKDGAQEIPVQHFIDLAEDRISSWRLEEVGFTNRIFRCDLDLAHEWNGFIVKRKIVEQCGMIKLNGEDTSITTFTELLTLIKFLTPQTK